MIQCREKQLPHYFGRLVHALDIFKHAENEGQWNEVRTLTSIPLVVKEEEEREVCLLVKCCKFFAGLGISGDKSQKWLFSLHLLFQLKLISPICLLQ